MYPQISTCVNGGCVKGLAVKAWNTLSGINMVPESQMVLTFIIRVLHAFLSLPIFLLNLLPLHESIAKLQ